MTQARQKKEYDIKETYPIEVQSYPAPKMILHAYVYPMQWDGDTYKGAGVFIDHCCQESIDRCDEFYPHRTTTREPEKFLRMLFKKEPVDICPFCGAGVELQIESKEARDFWY